jgi:5,10-methylene-tetrahydrofolate dehydrogenase/methenyl tetrahydrofolate cyclohydrolase
VLKKNEDNVIEITSEQIEKKLSPNEEKIEYYVKSMCKDREEMNVVIMPNTKKFDDNEIIKFLKLVKDVDGKVIMMCDEEKKEEVETIFRDDSKITLPTNMKSSKR